MIRLASNLTKQNKRISNRFSFEIRCLNSTRPTKLASLSPSIENMMDISTDAESDSDCDASKFMLILGKPGGGKGTISSKILKDFPVFKHLSTGDLLRKHVREGTEIGKEAKSYMDSGGLVPDELIIQLVMEDAEKYIEDGKSLLLDGFPRTMDQAVALDKSLEVDLVIDLNVPVETIVERISDSIGKSIQLFLQPSPCPWKR
mmetsp:Transcript_18821/g.21795  ORF Transcript_18821/g.21795 Transcript_18821/m.21795 type:complete len:203 (+) Transcript_18821:332-940(+)